MRRKAVESSNIASIGYAKRTETLEIRFKNGRIYHYDNVPEKVHDELIEAESHGKYMNANIKGVYEFKEVKES